jgi:hypothetical protein
MIPDQLVDQLHKILVDEIRVRRPEYLRGPFTIAEIYQDLVPYRTHRDRIGASMNGDYEHALLRLLAGAGDYLRIESEPARKRMEDELGSSNPNTGLFREFAALDVRLNQALIPVSAEALPVRGAEARSGPVATGSEGGSDAASPSGRGEDGTSGGEAAGAQEAEPDQHQLLVAAAVPARRESGGAEPRAVEPAAPQGTLEGGRPTAAPANPPEACRWCRETLPRRAILRYCPFCGMDVNLVPCPSCGEELEPGWRFCIACGTEVTTE